jgi:iron complex transport system permease protein
LKYKILTVAGLIFQTVLNNALADSFTLGLASGATFGSNASNNLGNLTLIKIDWLNTSLISPNCQNRYMLVVIINIT